MSDEKCDVCGEDGLILTTCGECHQVMCEECADDWHGCEATDD